MNVMDDDNKPSSSEIQRRLADIEAVTAAMNRSLGKAMREHKLMGRSVVGYRDGKVMHIPPEEILDYDENGELIEPKPDQDS
ncbi:hypothetical protein [Thalassoroseus pseudoceratinae]|uniref:hypothetical protein n=1 Tax=Thalassoroseus pseudoceratinae TaxID=2713176 RepID=UPI001423FC47|nr:hypothetical protein [Thalassoroseus pseudoceratinae]